MSSRDDARNRAASILAQDRLDAADAALAKPVPPGAVVFWDFKADAWSIKCETCGIPPRALLSPGRNKPLTTYDDSQAHRVLQDIQEKHNQEKHPKEQQP